MLLSSLVIPTARLDLVFQSPDEVLAWVDSLPPEVRAEFSPVWIERVKSTAPGDPWALSFAAVDRESGAQVGSCTFKGPPDSDGVVEVAYGIETEFGRQGYATEATEALVQFAFASGRVRIVRAHTKLDNAASIRVLEKCGFRRLGEVMDPEDGLVCRWER
jgi:RimJ/RimL family protein N-acetyltransferase